MQDVKATLIWLLLMSMTFMVFMLAQNGVGQKTLVLIMLLTAWFKGQLIIDHFMGLRRVAVLWRMIISIWLVFILSVILSVYIWGN